MKKYTLKKKTKKKIRNISIFQILTCYNLPISGKISIIHRISGVLTFLCLPIFLYIFNKSITSHEYFNKINIFISSNKIIKLFLYISICFLIFHYISGIRFLLMDINKNLISRKYIKKTAIIAILIYLILIIIFSIKFFKIPIINILLNYKIIKKIL